MRVLMLNYEYPPLGGGAGNATHYLLKQFTKIDNLKIDLVTSSSNGYYQKSIATNVNIYYLDIGKKNNNHFQSTRDLLKYSWKALLFSKKLTKKFNYNLIHAFFGIPCGYLAMRLKIPYLVSLRGSDVPFYNPRFKKLDKYIFKHLSHRIWKKAVAVIANSQGLKDLALKTIPHQKIEIIYNGVDTQEFYPKKNNNGIFTILSTSRFIRRKGIEYLIKAFHNFSKENNKTKLLLAGEGDLTIEFKQLATNLNIADIIEFRGAIRHDQMPPLYREADVFVMPSINEGMSNSILEAMASGLPIITTDTGGTREMVDKSNGIIILKKDSPSITAALNKLSKNHSLLTQMSKSSRNKAEQMSWQKMSRQYFKLYQQYA